MFTQVVMFATFFAFCHAFNFTDYPEENMNDTIITAEELETEVDDHYEFIKPAHYQLEDFLMNNYNKRLLPKRFLNESVKVKFSIELYQIIQVNEPSQYMLINAWIVERWYDDFLYWNPKEYGGIKEIILPKADVWLPDTTLYNSLEMNDQNSVKLINVKLTTNPAKRSTLVELLYPTLHQFSCMLDLRYFPFDVQNCKMIFGSWTHDMKSIDYQIYNDTGKGGAVGLDQFIENEGWHILGTMVQRNEVKYDCCANKYTLLFVSLLIRRKPLFYLVNLIAPTCVITLISIVGFFSSATINEYRQEKITLGITTLLSMSIMLFMVADKMPSTSSFIPLIGWFYTCMMLLISVGCLCASIVIYIQKQGISGKRPDTRTMRWAQRLGHLCRLQMPMLMKEAYMLKAKQEKERLKRECLMKRQRRKSVWQKLTRTSGTSPHSLSVPAPRMSISFQKMTNGNVRNSLFDRSEDPSEDDRSIGNENGHRDSTVSQPASEVSKNSTTIDFDSTLFGLGAESLGMMTDMSATGQKRSLAEIEYDWLAAVIERLLLIVFIFLFFLSSVGINILGMYYWVQTKVDDYITV